MHSFVVFIFITILISFLNPTKVSSSFIVSNNCPFTIWPGTLAGSGTPSLPTTGFRLDSGTSVKIGSTPGWSGRVWARTGCQFDSMGLGSCLTGDCGGKMECNGNGAAPPTSLFEITFGMGNDKDFYDVSLVDGYNLPIVAWPLGDNVGACNATGCVSDVNIGCPKELQVVDKDVAIACKSACEAFGRDEYCCSGQFANPNTCKPSVYSALFKEACPSAYSYAFDDATSTFTCKAYDYAIVFCPTTNGAKQSQGYTSPPPPSAVYAPPPPPATLYTSPSPPEMSILRPYQKHNDDEDSTGMEEASSSSMLRPLSVLILSLGMCSLFA